MRFLILLGVVGCVDQSAYDREDMVDLMLQIPDQTLASIAGDFALGIHQTFTTGPRSNFMIDNTVLGTAVTGSGSFVGDVIIANVHADLTHFQDENQTIDLSGTLDFTLNLTYDADFIFVQRDGDAHFTADLTAQVRAEGHHSITGVRCWRGFGIERAGTVDGHPFGGGC